jgi:pre-mRNA-splicing factor SPF27
MATEKTAESPVIFDSLPYYDNDLDKYPFLREKVERELAKEPKPPEALHPRVPPPITLFAVRARTMFLISYFSKTLYD